MKSAAPQLWSFAAAFAALIACFVGSTWYSQRQETAVSVLSQSLVTNAMPSIERLSEARTDLRRIEALTRQYGEDTGEGRQQALKEILAMRETIDEDVDAYLRLPIYPGENEIWLDIRHALGRVDAAIASLRAYVQEGDRKQIEAAVADVDTACEEGAAALNADIAFNAREGALIGDSIARIHARARAVAWTLDAVCAVLAILFAAVAVRFINDRARLVRERADLVAQRAEELEQFAGRVAHDIRNPLSGLRFTLANLRRQAGGDDKMMASIERGERGIERANRLLEGLLAFAQAGARPEPGVRAPVREVVDGVLEDLQPTAAEAHVDIKVEDGPDLWVACDRSILSAVVSNLLRNAVRYIGDGDERRVTVRASAAGRFVRLDVDDTGVGVPADLRDAIFEPFVRGRTRGHGGIGLGLATVKRVCEAHGGRAWHEPGPGERGSRFSIELPAAAAPAAPVLVSTSG